MAFHLYVLMMKVSNHYDFNGYIKCSNYTTKGYVADIEDNGSKAKVFIIFHNTPRNEFYSQTAKISSSELSEKGIQSGTFVPCVMKLDEEYQIYGFKKLA